MSNYCLYPNQCGIGADCSECYQRHIESLTAENIEFKALAEAVTYSEFEGIQIKDIDGVNWFDARAKALSPNGES